MSIYTYIWGWRHLGIEKNDLVLEVGSGGRPLARSDVLCDMFIEDSWERAEGPYRYPIVKDRPTVCANAERLPFRDKSFDFLVSIHMLEHLTKPECFLEEAMGVAKRGYIVTPSKICEWLTPRETHLWLVEISASGLLLKQKKTADEIGLGNTFHIAWQQNRHFRRFFYSTPNIFEVRFIWHDRFHYQVQRISEMPPLWFTKSTITPTSEINSFGFPPREKFYRTMRKYLSMLIRSVHSRKFCLYDLLACPKCYAPLSLSEGSHLLCANCGKTYEIRPDGIPILLI